MARGPFRQPVNDRETLVLFSLKQHFIHSHAQGTTGPESTELELSLRVPRRVTCEEECKGKQYLIPDKLPLAFLHSERMCESQRFYFLVERQTD